MMKTKTCTTCKVEKNIEHFGFSRPSVYRANCKICQNKYNKEYKKKNPDKVCEWYKRRIPKLREWRRINNLRRNEYNKQWKKDNPILAKEQKLRFRYGLSYTQYIQMLEDQNYKCTICNDQLNMDKHTNVDHDHNTGKVRGVLCSGCNHGLGNFKDSIMALNNAIKYLNKKI